MRYRWVWLALPCSVPAPLLGVLVVLPEGAAPWVTAERPRAPAMPSDPATAPATRPCRATRDRRRELVRSRSGSVFLMVRACARTLRGPGQFAVCRLCVSQ